MITEQELIDKLRSIERLFEGATTDGERAAAGNALDRLRKRLDEAGETDPDVEYKFTPGDRWSCRLLIALLRRYGFKPYRYKRQRYTTVMVRISPKFVDEVLWPEFVQLDKTLETYLDSITDRVISQGIHGGKSDADVVDEPKLR